MGGFENPAVLKHVQQVCETTDAKEVAQKLATGKWIAFYATCEEPPKFCLGRVSD